MPKRKQLAYTPARSRALENIERKNEAISTEKPRRDNVTSTLIGSHACSFDLIVDATIVTFLEPLKQTFPELPMQDPPE